LYGENTVNRVTGFLKKHGETFNIELMINQQLKILNNIITGTAKQVNILKYPCTAHPCFRVVDQYFFFFHAAAKLYC